MERQPERRFADFVDFLRDFVSELNALSEEGCVLLVEGSRDVRAMRGVGYAGRMISIAELRRPASKAAIRESTVVILTDLDREGGRLASRYSKSLAHDGFRVSLQHRARLLGASKGVFRHIENLGRFSST